MPKYDMVIRQTAPTKFDVLDHGFVRLVDSMGDDLSIVRAARVSYDADWRTGDDEGKDKKLIQYLWKNKHTSPFEAVTFTFEIKCPLFIARQWHRHRTWAYNEVSARYTALPNKFYTPNPDKIGIQSTSNKQMRELTSSQHSENLGQIEEYKKSCESMFELYHSLMDSGWPRELARGVLPTSTYTRFFGTVNLRNLLHFISLRDHEHAQLEVQVYAQALKNLIKPITPIALEVFERER